MNNLTKSFNRNIEKGFSIFQFVLIGVMIVGTFFSNSFLILFSLFTCLIGYFEPTDLRFCIKQRGKK